MNQRRHCRLPFVGALALAAALTACSRPDDEGLTAARTSDVVVAEARERGPARAPDRATPSTAEALSDAAIVTKITAALMADEQLRATQIDVRVEDGRITLTGIAPDVGSLARAGSLVQSIDGVRSVDNQLTVARHG